MKIASNTPNSFHPRDGYDFVQLGDNVDEVSFIILMLEKNWGSASVEKIRALTYWISSYPREIPCYIIGCETTIPEKEVSRYRHEGRDNAIRALCDEVLKRSVSIGVRGEITYKYLTEILGYANNKVDVIFESNAKDNNYKLNSFLKKNNLELGHLIGNILTFQVQPFVIYERSISFEKNIFISHPYLTVENNKVRLNADVRIDGQTKTLWCETDEVYRQFLMVERSDAFLCAILPFAMRSGKDISCEAPVSEQFLHNLNEILIPQLCTHDYRLYKTEIIASSDSAPMFCGNGVATGMSCGVDSFYTVNLYKDSKFKSMNLTHLYCGNYLYGNDGPIYERAESAAKDLDIPLIRTSTNINEEFRLPHLYTHFFKTMFGVLSLRKLFRIYYYSSAEDFSHFQLKDNSVRDTAQFELLLLYVFGCYDFQVVTGGGKSDRLEKTKAISSSLAANNYLNVCLYPNKDINCGKCAKCMRTLLMLDLLESLDNFKNVFDIEAYQKNRLDSFVYLVSQKNTDMLSTVYKKFLQKEPGLIKQAEDFYLKNI